jgi:hypothetical protein
MTGLTTDHLTSLRDVVARLKAAKVGLESAVTAFNEKVKSERKAVEDAVATYVGVVEAFDAFRLEATDELVDRRDGIPDEDDGSVRQIEAIDDLIGQLDDVYLNEVDADDILPDAADALSAVLGGDVAELESLLESLVGGLTQ